MNEIIHRTEERITLENKLVGKIMRTEGKITQVLIYLEMYGWTSYSPKEFEELYNGVVLVGREIYG